MRKTVSVLIAFVLLVTLCSCAGAQNEETQEGLTVVTTVFPAYDFARVIVGEKGSVTLLVPPGSESHSFEPTPRDMLRIQSCDLLVCNGGESEAWMEQIADGLDGRVNVLSMLECVDALEEEIKEGMQAVHEEHEEHGEHEEHEEHGEHEEHEEEPEYDEHVWTSPRNAMEICRAICAQLCSVDGENAAYYTRNTADYCRELAELDREFREICDNAARDTLVFADRFPVRYFTEEYGLDYFAAFPGCADDTEPSARTVAFLIDRVREQDIPAVMVIEFSNGRIADVVCEDTGCKKLLFHSCHNVSAEELKNGVTYLELMKNNTEAVREALN